MITSKSLTFETGEQVNRKTFEFFPKELLKCFRPVKKEVITGKGKNKKVETVEDDDILECFKPCSFFFTIKTEE